MEDWLSIVRLLHVLFGVFWVGSVFFTVLILKPRLAKLGPNFEKPVMGALMPRVVPAMFTSAIIVFVTGSIITFNMRAGDLGSLLTTGWGLMISLGIVATLAAISVGLGGLTPTGIKMGKISGQLDGQPPTPAQATTLARLGRRMDVLERVDFALVLIAVATMPLARFM
ncbi:MAG: hypothetical protein OEV61_08430 [Chloroflexota bacterium]|jgi:hypothetical protein|nr:hypothetical protein [Chloroflexota bacterium]MDH5244410.1 hypothetical protein [Chloroflexota bacterium]